MLAFSALLTVLPALTSAATCVQFDSDKNLYAFGGEQDVELGTADKWGCESLVLNVVDTLRSRAEWSTPAQHSKSVPPRAAQ